MGRRVESDAGELRMHLDDIARFLLLERALTDDHLDARLLREAWATGSEAMGTPPP